MADKKQCVKQVKETTKLYDDGTITVEVKEIENGDSKVVSKTITQDKLTRKKNNERVIKNETVSNTYYYDDGSKLNQTKVYRFTEKKHEKKLEKDLVTSYK